MHIQDGKLAPTRLIMLYVRTELVNSVESVSSSVLIICRWMSGHVLEATRDTFMNGVQHLICIHL